MAHRNGRKEKRIDLHKIGAIIRKNFVVLGRDKVRIMPLILFPVFMILIFGFTTGNIPRHIPTALVVYDHSPLSERFQGEIAANNVYSLRYLVGTEGEARNLLDAGKVSAIIVLPPNIEEDISRGLQARITIIVDESDSAVAGVTKQALQMIVNSMSAELSSEKVGSFQQSVAEASGKLQLRIAMQTDDYAGIASYAAGASQSLSNSQRRIAEQMRTLEAGKQPLIPIFLIPRSSEPVSIGGNTTYLSASAATQSTEGLLAFFGIISDSTGSAEKGISAALSSALKDAGKEEALRASNKKDVEEPVKAIAVFTAYNKKGLLLPLVYGEKPAYGTGRKALDFLIPAIIALTIFQGAVMGMGRAIAGEKKEGSLTRVFLTPTSNVTIILGTLLFYVIFEIFRSIFIIFLAVSIFHIAIEGSLLLMLLIIVIYAGVCSGIGMFISTLVKTEQQYMGMAMLASIPTMFLAGVFFPVQAMPRILQGAATLLPLTYAASALRSVMIKGFSLSQIIVPLLFLILFLSLILGAVLMAFKREIA